MFDICLLGTGGMMPTPDRYLTSLIVRYNGTTVLVDCGEGTQIPLQTLKWGFKDINIILFTHYHGDHITGLPGILYQMLNANRTEDLMIYGPPGIEIIENMTKVLFPKSSFNIYFNILYPSSNIDISQHNLNSWKIEFASMRHSTSCLAYSFIAPRKPKFDPTIAKLQNIPVKAWKTLQSGNIVYMDNKVYTPEMVLGTPRKGLKITYSTDTRPNKKLIDLAKDSDVFIGEGMYGDDNDLDKAKEKLHSTFSETARVAKEANVKELWLTHYGPAMPNPERYIQNARHIFPNTLLGKGLMEKILRFED